MKAAIALGSNLGDRLAILRGAVKAIHQLDGVRPGLLSSVWQTRPVGYADQPDFYNAVITVFTDWSPHRLLGELQAIEQRFKRVRTVRNGPRTLDLDLLFVDDQVLDDSLLTLPHPRMAQRAFVLGPLLEVSPDWRHPVVGLTVQNLWDELSEHGGVLRCKENLAEN